ncbi:MAG: N-acetylneuraminate synthase family protein [Vulcanimicrobiota bacterium]
MIIEIRKGNSPTVDSIRKLLAQHGNELETIEGKEVYDTLHVIGDVRAVANHLDYIESLPGVTRAWRISSGYKNIARIVSGRDGQAVSRDNRIVEISGPDGAVRRFGDNRHIFVVGPDSVQTEEQVFIQARQVAKLADEYGLRDRVMFRAGAFKPRTRPTDFRGLGMQGVALLDRVREETGLPYVSEVMDHTLVEQLAGHLDCFQIGTRNAQDFKLLETVGQTGKPVILKRGFGNDAEEWFNAAEYIANQNNLEIILCERGVKTMFAGKGYNRFTPDLNVIRFAQQKTILPVIYDPSHAAGDDRLVVENIMSALPYGPAGTITEIIHSEAFRPEQLCDAKQALPMDCFRAAVEAVLKFEEHVAPALARAQEYFLRRNQGQLAQA